MVAADFAKYDVFMDQHLSLKSERNEQERCNPCCKPELDINCQCIIIIYKQVFIISISSLFLHSIITLFITIPFSLTQIFFFFT